MSESISVSADAVPPGELDRLRETIHVLSDQDLVRALTDMTPAVEGSDAVRALAAERLDHGPA